jgi:hypothetical protein
MHSAFLRSSALAGLLVRVLFLSALLHSFSTPARAVEGISGALRDQTRGRPAAGNKDSQVHAVNRLNAAEGPAFQISGGGALPALEAQAKTNAGSQFAPALRPTASATARITLHSPARFVSRLQQQYHSSPQLFVLLALTGALVAVCIFLAWHSTTCKTRPLLGKWPAAGGHDVRH